MSGVAIIGWTWCILSILVFVGVLVFGFTLDFLKWRRRRRNSDAQMAKCVEDSVNRAFRGGAHYIRNDAVLPLRKEWRV